MDKYKNNNLYEENNKYQEIQFNEDAANEVINIEIRELEDWVFNQMKILKKNSYELIDNLKLKQSNNY